MEQVTFCKECRFAEQKKSKTGSGENVGLTGNCLSPDVPIQDFVYRLSFCHSNNCSGECKFFQPLAGYAGYSNKGNEP